MYNNGGKFNRNGGGFNIGGFHVRPLYLYIGAAILVIIALSFVMRFLNTSLVVHFGAVAGVLLLLANLRELIGQSYAQRSNTALLNCLIGGALVCAWLSQLVSVLLWIPAVALLAVAVPLVVGRTSVYTSYVQTARGAVDTVRRTMGR